MAGVGLEIVDIGLEEAITGLDGVEHLDQYELLDATGRLLQMSTRNRLTTTKTAPDGSGWKANNERTSTLYASGELSRSVDYLVSGATLHVGSALVYARIHQQGGVIEPKEAKRLAFMVGNSLVFAMKVTIPARPYIGLSNEDRTDVIEMVADTIMETLH